MLLRITTYIFPWDHGILLGNRHTSFAGARTGPGPTVLESATSLMRHSFLVSLAGPGPRRVCYCRTELLGSGRNLLRGPPSNRFEVVRELRMGGLCGTVWCVVPSVNYFPFCVRLYAVREEDVSGANGMITMVG
jgi:hypothetical protein